MSGPPLIPEILSKEDLIFHLKKSYESIRRINEMNYGQLISLYRQMLLPLPQRDYRQNNRGKMLTKKRIESGLQSRLERNIESKSVFSSSSCTPKRAAPTDRLMPPPKVTSVTRFKLSTTTSSQSQLSKVNTLGNDRNGGIEKEEISTSKRKKINDETAIEGSKPKRVKITWP